MNLGPAWTPEAIVDAVLRLSAELRFGSIGLMICWAYWVGIRNKWGRIGK